MTIEYEIVSGLVPLFFIRRSIFSASSGLPGLALA